MQYSFLQLLSKINYSRVLGMPKTCKLLSIHFKCIFHFYSFFTKKSGSRVLGMPKVRKPLLIHFQSLLSCNLYFYIFFCIISGSRVLGIPKTCELVSVGSSRFESVLVSLRWFAYCRTPKNQSRLRFHN